MEKLKNKAAERYMRQVRSLLPCSRGIKDEITAPLRKSVDAFLAEDPAADAEAIRTRFGTPETIAASCLENTDTAEVLRRLQTKRRIVSLVVAAVILALLIWVGVFAHAELNSKKVRDGFTITDIYTDTEYAASSINK